LESNVYASKQTDVYNSKQDKLKISLEDLENESVTLSVRVPLSYKTLYKKLSSKQKTIFKLGVMSLLDSIYKGRITDGNPVIVNMNINMNKNEANNNVNVSVNIQLKEFLEDLYKWLDVLSNPAAYYSKNIPPNIRDDARRFRARVAKLLSTEVN
jgi:hypothetical protein